MRHGEVLMSGAARTSAARGSQVRAAAGAVPPIEFPSRFVYAGNDLPSASAALRTQGQQEQMMLRLSNQFHSSGLQHPLDQSQIPAGYTYLAQFAVHDMLLSTAFAGNDGRAADRPANLETPGLDLRSLYGAGPDGSAGLYEPALAGRKKGRLRIGHLNKARPPLYAPGAMADVPRDRTPGSPLSAGPTEPALADRRNADNLILAQLTALFINFHNILFDLSNNAGDANPFERARRTAVEAYRRILWNDLIGRLTDSRIFAHHTPTLTQPRDANWNVPKESAFAVLRFGHSMVRSKYQLSVRLNGISGSTKVSDLLRFFDKDSGQDLPPADFWKIEWERFFQTGQNQGDGFNNSAPIRPAMTSALAELSTNKMSKFPSAEGALTSLAFRALMRGFFVGLPTGQAAARAVSAQLGFGIRSLSPEEIAASLKAASNEGLCKLGEMRCLDHGDIDALKVHTPLFLYVLLEAQIIGRGSKLGPVGSDFLCHAFAGGLRIPANDPDRNIQPISGIVLPGTMPGLLEFLEQHRSPEV
jgi:hypothetical protein